MKKGLLAVAIIVLAVYIFQPTQGEASSQLDKINKELAKVRQEMSAATHNRNQADKDKAYILSMKDKTAKSVTEIVSQINEVGGQLNKVQSQIDDKETQVKQAGADLEAAENRIVKQDKLLQSRVRLMYTNGLVSYLDVLLSATSFSDFIDRMDSLSSILGQDREILASRKKDKVLVEEKKQEVENSLAEVKTMYGKLAGYHDLLKDKEKQKEVMVLKYKDQADELDEISSDQEELLMKLAKQVSDLEAKKKTIKVYYNPGGKLGMPLRASWHLSSPFGYRIHPITGAKKLHTGMDMAVPKGTPIYAAESGVVIVAQWWSDYGNCVIIDHGGGLWTIYGHIRDGGIKVEKGQAVKRGQKIAEVGSTGMSTGNHLHFEVRLNEKAVNPAPYLK
ncbi:peptidoglycan DD-metalloendopeptidase family protein [Paenibacillus sacheonensis]|uniref:Peptidoglycan DD-metalloendopeptidase family protein n=1 Tax=Paenibacillus sacheonensis TaxID=742054 RepID=A0A7X4YV64_9BACL|nr:murein DD-endopeptidase MepM/ murein hydrolase activator NlpD [Paenibacillus sacheonensis]NBC73122.1 peptidoglycan DD-metalloendopeptidase family protein [Paenibacillus sacheonensis]